MKHGKASRDSESTAFSDFASTTEKVCPILFFYFFLLLFVVGFVCVFRSITSMAEPTEEEEEEVKAERINRQCNLQRRVFLHVK